MPYLEGTLGGPVRAAVSRHLEACETCREEFRQVQRTGGLIRQAAPPAPLPAPDLWSRLERRLPASPAPRPQPRLVSTPVLTGCLACLLLGSAAYLWLQPGGSALDVRDDGSSVARHVQTEALHLPTNSAAGLPLRAAAGSNTGQAGRAGAHPLSTTGARPAVAPDPRFYRLLAAVPVGSASPPEGAPVFRSPAPDSSAAHRGSLPDVVPDGGLSHDTVSPGSARHQWGRVPSTGPAHSPGHLTVAFRVPVPTSSAGGSTFRSAPPVVLTPSSPPRFVSGAARSRATALDRLPEPLTAAGAAISSEPGAYGGLAANEVGPAVSTSDAVSPEVTRLASAVIAAGDALRTAGGAAPAAGFGGGAAPPAMATPPAIYTLPAMAVPTVMAAPTPSPARPAGAARAKALQAGAPTGGHWFFSQVQRLGPDGRPQATSRVWGQITPGGTPVIMHSEITPAPASNSALPRVTDPAAPSPPETPGLDSRQTGQP